MRYIKLGSTGLEISPIALGAMTYGEPGRGYPAWSLREEDSRPLIKHALEAPAGEPPLERPACCYYP